MVRLRAPQRGQTLIIIMIGVLLLGGAAASVLVNGKSADELRKEIGHLVPDKERRNRLDGVIDRLKKETDAFTSEHHRLGQEALALMERHDARPEEFDPLMARADDLNARTRKALVDLRFELRQGLSPEEWRSLFSTASGK